MSQTYDFTTNILIIGGGPSGSTLARKLSKNKIENILVEKNYNYDKPCGGGVKNIVFEEFNIPKELESKHITKFDLYSPNKKVSVDLTKTPISIVLRKEFDHANRKLAQEEGTKLLNARFIGFKRRKNFIEASLKTKDKIIKVKANYLVGADGVTSSVRKALTNSYPKAILTHYCNIPSDEMEKCEFYFGKDFAPKEYAWVFPHGDKLSVGTVLREDLDSKKLFKNFKDTIVKNDNTKTKGFYIPTWVEDDIFYKDRVFLLGDAAGQVLPFTYEGIYYVMKSADILADAIINDKPEEYETKWNKTYKKRFKFFRRMQGIFLSSTYMSDKMISFFQNEKLQQRGLKYWEGTAKPLGLTETFVKIVKHLIKN